MSKRPRLKHSPTFKGRVALDAVRGEKTLAELSKQSDVHPNEVTDWKNQTVESAASVFGAEATSEPKTDVKKPRAKLWKWIFPPVCSARPGCRAQE